MNTRLVASILALLVSGSSAHASMTLSSWQPAQKAAATTTSTATSTSTATPPSDAAPGKAQAPVLPRTVTKPNVDTPATSAATGRSAGSKRDKIEATNGGDERSEDSKARRAQRAPDATKGADDDASTSRKRGLEKIGRMLEAMHRMRPNFFARWR
jgi:hypothetical protein